MWQAFHKVFKREWYLFKASHSQWAQPWIFLCLISLIPAMMIGENIRQMPIVGSMLVIFAMVLAVMLTLDKSIRDDHQQDTLAQWMQSPWPLWWLMFAKSVSHWIFWVFPMVLLSPVIMILYGLDYKLYWVLVFALMLGTPLLSFVGLMSAALTLGLQASGFLLAVIMLPLVTPMIILSLSPVQSSIVNQSVTVSFLLLTALSIISAVLCPLACAFGVKVNQ